MKNIFNKLFVFEDSVLEKTAEELLKDKAVTAALDYAGYKYYNVLVESVELTEDKNYCVVTYSDNQELATRCAMVYTAYVDTETFEVAGFSGQGEKSWLDSAETEVPSESAEPEDAAA